MTDVYIDKRVILSRCLIEAASYGNLKECKRLVEEMGALIDFGGRTWNTSNPYDIYTGTALMAAAAKGHLDVCKYLCEKGADVNLVDNNEWSALAHAAKGGHRGVVTFLVETAKIKTTKWAATNAAIYGHVDICEYLFNKTEVSLVEIESLDNYEEYEAAYNYLQMMRKSTYYKRAYEKYHKKAEQLSKEIIVKEQKEVFDREREK